MYLQRRCESGWNNKSGRYYLTHNDAVDLTGGYIVTDLNGDNVTNLNDVLIAYYNSNKFVSVMRP